MEEQNQSQEIYDAIHHVSAVLMNGQLPENDELTLVTTIHELAKFLARINFIA